MPKVRDARRATIAFTIFAMNKSLSSFRCSLALAGLIFTLTLAADDHQELTNLLNEFLAGASVDDASAHDRFWAEDLVYTSSAGLRFGKAEIMAGLESPREENKPEPAVVYTAEDIRIQIYDDAAVVAFRLVGTPLPGASGIEPPPGEQEYFNTGTFLKRDGAWQAVAWQATRIPQACPPVGYSRDELAALKASGFVIEDDRQRNSLAVDLLACLGFPDPAIRDGIAYEGLSTWMRGQALTRETIDTLFRSLLAQIQSEPDLNGFRQPFAALLLSEVARTDRMGQTLTPEMRNEMVAVAAAYLTAVRDYRGFDTEQGWRHGVAHGSDIVVQLALNPAIEAGQLQLLVNAVAAQVAPAGEVFYRYGEPGRLARAIYYAYLSGVLDDTFWAQWFEAVSSPEPMANWGESWLSQSGLAKRHNTQAFLLALHFNAIAGEQEQAAGLAELALQALTRMSGS